MSLQNAAAAQQAFEGALNIVPGDLPAHWPSCRPCWCKKFEQAGANLSALIEGEYPKHPGLLFLSAQNELTGNRNIEAAEAALTVA
ncbi:MAG: hypothetical protein IPG64_19365 [Haliea sp.]|nr:hypothetical protein [Haliea sp.]